MSEADQRVLRILAGGAPENPAQPGLRPPERAFAIREIGGQLTAFDGLIAASLLARPGEGGMVKRRCFPAALSPSAREVQMLVIELGGVYTYCRTYQGVASVVVTRDGGLMV